MFGMVVERVFITEMSKISSKIDRKMVSVGITMILTECPQMLNGTYNQNWGKLLQALVELFEVPSDNTSDPDNYVDDEPSGYQAGFTQLAYAKPVVHDFLAHISNEKQFLVESLAKLSKSKPGTVPNMMTTLEPTHQQAMFKYCAQANVTLS